MSNEKMRQEFEEWAVNYGVDDYESAWQAWKASRAALRVKLPKYYSTDSIGLAYCADAVVDSLDAAGVRYK